MELQHLVVRRGLAQTRGGGMFQADRSTLIALLKAYDAGAEAATGVSASGHRRMASNGSPCGETDADVIQRILCSPGPKGVDIGGTLVKTVLALPRESASDHIYPETFGMTGKTRHDLEFEYQVGETVYVARFVSGATAQLKMAIGCTEKQMRESPSTCSVDLLCNTAGGEEGDTQSDSTDSNAVGERSFSKDAAAARSEESTEDPDAITSSTAASRDPSEDVRGRATVSRSSSFSNGLCNMVQKVYTAGGGAHKFAPLFRDALQVELWPVKEMEAVVDGLLFLHEHGPKNGLFTVDENAEHVPIPWLEPLFPFLLVNMGSGTSILKVSSAKAGDYVRVGGTACGGGTFLGLARALTSAETFEEALDLAQKGDASKCDLLVQDIYGADGSSALGLPGSLTASNFGRLCEPPSHDHVPDMSVCCEQDMARSLLQMVTQQSVLLSSVWARNTGCVDRVFFVGGFVEQENRIARAAISANFRSLGGSAYFLQHSDYLGALGSLRHCMQDLSSSPRA
eukprot:CAMPEP_0178415210 /NCGR_PEP_ID=MMETSP0689_2-20121128/23435_1 /TAXON_ID=160604 /ORGANISM="Amphidinium massartii, Strain CS-259" /LENGTH=512 /DNA_ID=CAMNT_0020036525 /DNA_START=79 /DNA_END=1617 /DNA_ORIENTATION=-